MSTSCPFFFIGAYLLHCVGFHILLSLAPPTSVLPFPRFPFCVHTVCMHMYVCMCVWKQRKNVCSCICICVHACVSVHACVHACVCVHMYVGVCVCMCVLCRRGKSSYLHHPFAHFFFAKDSVRHQDHLSSRRLQ